MSLLIVAPGQDSDWWARELGKASAGMDVRVWPEAGDPADIRYALAWKPPHGALAAYPNLKAVFSLGAGVDHLLSDPDLPDVTITRVVDPYLTSAMTEYVVLHVLRHHRGQPALDAQQRAHVWDDRASSLRQADEQPVGIMGLGELGRAAADALAALGFDVAGWSRSPKEIPGIRCFHGADGLEDFLDRTRILVCLLPLTPETEGILDARLFDRLPDGASLINAARGGHLVEDDLLAALESGRIAHATLDVFRTEPLPDDHPFWDHPAVTVTPHNASITDPRSVVSQILENVARAEAGRPLLHTVDRAAGY